MYAQEISRSNPTSFVFLIDQSTSMEEPIDGGKRKADAVADALNRLIEELSIKSSKAEGIYDYFHIGVIGYGAQTGNALLAPFSDRSLVPIGELANSPAREETRTKKSDDGAGGLVTQETTFPIWLEPVASGGTPMTQALTQAQAMVSDFVTSHPDCFPPVVLNLTDGESTDGSPTGAAEAIRGISSSDGNVLLFNLHVSSHGGEPITFPDSGSAVATDQYATQLFEMSSVLPEKLRAAASSKGYSVTEQSRGFVFNADIASIVEFLDVGTHPSEDLR
jgi:hypothetical protein